MQHLDEGTIHAWLDGELPSVEREAAEAHIAQCEQCAAAVAEARGFIAASSRILMALDAVPGGVLPAAQGSSAPAGKRTPARFTVSRAWMAAAAVLILSTATAIVVRPRSDKGVATLAQRDEMRAPRVDSPVSTSAAAPAIAPEEKKSANAVALKAPAPNAAARGVTAPNAPASNALAPRRAALAEKADSSTFSDRKPSALALLPVAPAGQAADAMVAKAESPAAPAASRMEAQSGAAGASGNIRARPRLPQSLIASEQNAPQVVSRSTTTENGDTVVTTVYSVNGVSVSLIDESTSRNLRQPEAKVGVADQPMAMARDTALEAHSITWSDSTGRTRTLRGAMSQAELERVKRALFGPTP